MSEKDEREIDLINTARCHQVFIVTEFFTIIVNDVGAKKSARSNRTCHNLVTSKKWIFFCILHPYLGMILALGRWPMVIWFDLQTTNLGTQLAQTGHLEFDKFSPWRDCIRQSTNLEIKVGLTCYLKQKKNVITYTISKIASNPGHSN